LNSSDDMTATAQRALENPRGLRAITPYLFPDDPDKLIDFLKRAFGAEQTFRGVRPDGKVMHAEVKIGDSSVMMGSPIGQFGPMQASIYLYVKDCDAVYQQAIKAGGISVFEPVDMLTGERYGAVKDPFGNIWWVATHVEEPSPELRKRLEASFPLKSAGTAKPNPS
jgi:PhnB protein